MRRLLITPITPHAGVYPVAIALGTLLENQGLKVRHVTPIVEGPAGDNESALSNFSWPLSFSFASRLMSHGRKEELLEFIVAYVAKGEEEEDITLIQGCEMLGREMGWALSCDVIQIAAPRAQSAQSFAEEIQIYTQDQRSDGIIINCLDTLPKWSDRNEELRLLLGQFGKRVLGIVPPNPKLNAPRVKDLASFLEAEIVCGASEGDRRIEHFEIASTTMLHQVDVLTHQTLLICKADHKEAQKTIEYILENEIPLAAVLVLGEFHPDLELKKGKLPILTVTDDLWHVVMNLHSFDTSLIPLDDQERIAKSCAMIKSHIDPKFLPPETERGISPTELRFQLLDKAKQAKKTIVLPEGTDPRILKAANLAEKKKIAHCVLLGNPKEMHKLANQEGIELERGLELIDPEAISSDYIDALVNLRKHKGMDAIKAKEALSDPMMLGTMMLSKGDVDGLVGGACTTTAKTIVPALQVIRTTPSARVASSLFFMCLKDRVLVYADCAVNATPTAEDLADIALQSAKTAEAFGIVPRIAMISYSTGDSGKGEEVEKVKKATQLVKEKEPTLLIDGPLQYDAALSPEVAKHKAPNSPIAGNATLCIFPNLSTGNVTYKAVQRSSEILSIGPILQGLNKPVNDVSRGSSVDDILYTIAVTAIQATQP